MLAVSGTVVIASVNLTRRVAATRESESDRAHVRFSDLLMCADLTDLRSTNRPNSNSHSIKNTQSASKILTIIAKCQIIWVNFDGSLCTSI